MLPSVLPSVDIWTAAWTFLKCVSSVISIVHWSEQPSGSAQGLAQLAGSVTQFVTLWSSLSSSWMAPPAPSVWTSYLLYAICETRSIVERRSSEATKGISNDGGAAASLRAK